MFVEFGLKDTQSGLGQSAGSVFNSIVLTISIVNYGVLNCDIRTSVCVPAISVLGRVNARARTSNIDIVEYNVGSIGNEMVILWRESEDQVADD